MVKIQEMLHRNFVTEGEILQFAPETRIKMLGIFLAMSYEGSTVLTPIKRNLYSAPMKVSEQKFPVVHYPNLELS
jgi:hypothetical protein